MYVCFLWNNNWQWQQIQPTTTSATTTRVAPFPPARFTSLYALYARWLQHPYIDMYIYIYIYIYVYLLYTTRICKWFFSSRLAPFEFDVLWFRFICCDFFGFWRASAVAVINTSVMMILLERCYESGVRRTIHTCQLTDMPTQATAAVSTETHTHSNTLIYRNTYWLMHIIYICILYIYACNSLKFFILLFWEATIHQKLMFQYTKLKTRCTLRMSNHAVHHCSHLIQLVTYTHGCTHSTHFHSKIYEIYTCAHLKFTANLHLTNLFAIFFYRKYFVNKPQKTLKIIKEFLVSVACPLNAREQMNRKCKMLRQQCALASQHVYCYFFMLLLLLLLLLPLYCFASASATEAARANGCQSGCCCCFVTS